MKVYVITKGEYSDYHICAVTLDKDKAEKLRKKFSMSYEEADIEEFDTEEDEETMEHNLYLAHYDEITHKLDVVEREFEYREVYGVVYPALNGEFLFCNILADSREEALKIASDKFAKYRAEKMGL